MDLYHVIPDSEIKMHDLSMECKCNPHMEQDGDKILIRHSKNHESPRDKLIKSINSN